jgi:Protein of unknown function (DUF3617)
MQPAHWNIVGTALVALAIVVLAEAAEPIKLNIKPGLWEIASEGKIDGAPPIPDDQLARMTPEQRARFEAAMQASMAEAAKAHLSKNCVTPEKIARGLDIQQHNNASCDKKIAVNSASELDVNEDCSTDKGNTVMREHFQLSGSEQMSGSVHMVRTSAGKSMTIDSNIHGKWLGASCGDVKDVEIEK